MRNSEKSKPCPKNIPSTRMFIFVCVAYEEKCWLPERKCPKKRSFRQGVLSFAARITGPVPLA